MVDEKATGEVTKARAQAAAKAPVATNGSYVVPLVHAQIPARAVEVGFWAGLAGAAVLGVVDLPLALLLGAGVAVAHHGRR